MLLCCNMSYAAGGWVLEPSIKFDLGYDDNNGMDVSDPQEVTVTKATGELKLTKKSEAHHFKGAILADAVAYHGNDETIEDNSNQVAYFSTTFRRPRSKTGVNFNYRRDTLIREASADDSTIDPEEFGEEDPDASVDQFLDIIRQRVYLNPFFRYDLSRRMDSAFNYRFSAVDHDRTTDNNNDSFNLQNFSTNDLSASLGYKITPLDRIIGRLGYSLYATEDTDKEYTTIKISLGYERSISPTFKVGGNVGYRTTEFKEDGSTDNDDGVDVGISAIKTTGLTKFELKGGVALRPSSIGEVVQTQELVANVTRNLSERTVLLFRGRAYENTVISGGDSDNDRRSIEMKPEIRWQVSRSWSLGAAYRYRREKLESKPTFAEGNAFLVSVKYTHRSPLAQ